ncbi:MAG: FMN-binding negative transcriptional regulator [Proteobacteria bacterium]|nr:FMN-binding negative transcriptional regulator [Pseudomonadota bacterium]
MYVPKFYQTDEIWAKELIRRYPLAVLLTNGPRAPFATHLPTIVPPEDRARLDAGKPLVGLTMFGHLNRNNPHWAALQSVGPSVLVFQGPNSYVSPTIYETTPAAPTWNFTSVHLHGTLRAIDDRETTLQIIRWTVEGFEAEFGANWDMRPSLGYFDRIVHDVGAFAFEIEAVDAMFKLSQEQPAEVQERVVRSFATRESCSHHHELAKLMSRVNPAGNGS